jgi:hypothetical protein
MTNAIDRNNYPGIPEDFPIEAVHFALAGTQAKLNLVKEGGKYYASGTSPTEVLDDYLEMRDLVPQVLDYCQGEMANTNKTLDALLAQEEQNMVHHYRFRAIHVNWVIAKVREQHALATQTDGDHKTGQGA